MSGWHLENNQSSFPGRLGRRRQLTGQGRGPLEKQWRIGAGTEGNPKSSWLAPGVVCISTIGAGRSLTGQENPFLRPRFSIEDPQDEHGFPSGPRASFSI